MLTTKNWDAIGSSVVMALLGVVMLGGCTPSGTRALLDGDRLIREKKYPQAIEKLKIATQSAPDPARPKAWNFLGLAYHGAGRPTDAVAAYQKAIQSNQNFAAAHYNLGCLWLEQNNWQAAVSQLATYTVLERDQPVGWIKLGTAQLRGQQLDAAERSFQTALQLKSASAESLNGMAIVQLQRKRLRESIDLFNAALRQQPDYGPALLNLAVISQHYFTNRSAALQRYRSYLQTQPTGAQAQSVQRIVQQLEMELAPARAAETNATAANQLLASAAIVTTNQLQQSNIARANAPPPQTNAPPPPQTNTMVAIAQKTAPAVQDSQAVDPKTLPPTAPPSAPQAPQELTNGASRVAQPPEPRQPQSANDREVPAQKVQVVQIPEEPLPKTGQASLTNATDAVAAAPTSTGENPASRTDTNSIGAGLLVTHGKEKPGVGQRLNPLNWFRGRDKSSRAAVPSDEERAAEQKKPDPAQPKPIVASRENGRVIPAQPSVSRPNFPRYRYRSPARPAPGNRQAAEPHFAQGLKAHKERRLAAAMEAYQRAVDLDPSYYEAHYNFGLAAYDLRHVPRSLAAYEMALAIRPDSLDARFNFALSLLRGNYALDAATELERSLIDYPEESRVHFTLAKLYAEQLSELDAARQHYRRVLELDPQHPNAIPIRYWLAEHP